MPRYNVQYWTDECPNDIYKDVIIATDIDEAYRIADEAYCEGFTKYNYKFTTEYDYL